MRFSSYSLALLLAIGSSSSSSSLVAAKQQQQQCVTELDAHRGMYAKTLHRPAATVTLYKQPPAAAAAAPAAQRTAFRAAVVKDAAAPALPTVTVTAKPVAATTTFFITTGGPPGTTTITSYTLQVPEPSLATPALQRRGIVQSLMADDAAKKDRFNHDDTAETNGVDGELFTENDDDPRQRKGSNVYCSDVITETVEVSPRTVTNAARAGPTVTVTVTPTTKLIVKTSTVPAAPTATVVTGGYDVCNPTKYGRLYDWTAYQANALAFGVTTFSNITDPGSCCAAAANIPGALAWALCDGTNDIHESCPKNQLGPCFVTYLKTIPGYTSAESQCDASSDTSTFQYRKGTGQIGGPLQCASTYTGYDCFRPILLLLGNYVCLPSK
ncbi:hypothetical protein OC834_004208 [Tilletia horrida]|nr:hypothetical protein OC834_004208 [Tilletia horrida]